MCQVMGLKRSSPHQPQVPIRRKSKIRYSDKPSVVAQFREFSDNLYAKRRMHERMNKLICGLVLDAELAAEGAADEADDRRGATGLGAGPLAGRRLVGKASALEVESTKCCACSASRRARPTRSSSQRSTQIGGYGALNTKLKNQERPPPITTGRIRKRPP